MIRGMIKSQILGIEAAWGWGTACCHRSRSAPISSWRPAQNPMASILEVQTSRRRPAIHFSLLHLFLIQRRVAQPRRELSANWPEKRKPGVAGSDVGNPYLRLKKRDIIKLFTFTQLQLPLSAASAAKCAKSVGWPRTSCWWLHHAMPNTASAVLRSLPPQKPSFELRSKTSDLFKNGDSLIWCCWHPLVLQFHHESGPESGA